MPIQLPVINIKINEHLPRDKMYLIDMADNVVGIIEMEKEQVTTDIYISNGYIIEEGIINGTQYFTMKKAQCQFGYPGICYSKCQELDRCFLKRSRIKYSEK